MKHFTNKERSCKCGNCGNSIVHNEIHETRLELFRERLGMPFVITSGFRCAKHNKDSGGVENSLHTQGKADDGFPKPIKGTHIYKLSKRDLFKFAECIAVEIFEEVIVYKEGFIHLGSDI